MKKLLNNHDEILAKHRQKFTYLLVGGLLFLIDYSASLFAYHSLGLQAGWASASGFCASFIVGFTLNKKVVFSHSKESRHSVRMQVFLYLALAFINLFVTSFIVGYFVNSGVKIEIVKPVVVIIAAVWNFFILGRFIFAHKKPELVVQ